jgi:hypothetical protein
VQGLEPPARGHRGLSRGLQRQTYRFPIGAARRSRSRRMRGAPQSEVRLTHSANQDPEVRCQRRPTDAARSRVPSPICGERAAMPTHDRGRRHDLHRLPPVRPDDREQHPEQPIERTEARSFRGGPLQYSELMPERENLRRELEPRADRDSKRGQQGRRTAHSSCPRTVSVSGPQPQRPQHVPNIQ